MATSPTSAPVSSAVNQAAPVKAVNSTQISPPPFAITPLKTEHRYIKVLIYGPFGSGKTSLAGSSVDVADMEDVLMVNAESGTLSIEDADYITNRYNIDQVRAKDFKTVALVQEFLVAHTKARDRGDIEALKKLQARLFFEGDMSQAAQISEDAEGLHRLRRYRTVIVDSLTEIDTFSMYALLGIQTDMKLDADMDVAQFAEFRKNNQMMQLLVRAYRDLEMNVILVCSTQYNQDELKQFHWAPSLTGKLAAQVQGFVDIVGYMQVGKPKEGEKDAPRRLAIQPIGRFDAKNRIASFRDPWIDNPTFKKIMDAFKGVNKGSSGASAGTKKS